ncbi:MAG TPA: DMT family transporter [Desulfobacteria bacterium]|nr:DMT family transporter [Desulfobacteria bacterium]
MSKLVALLIAALSGVTMAVQGTANSRLAEKTSLWESTFLVHLVGTIIVGVIMLVFGVGGFRPNKWFSVPWYLYIGGVLSVLIIYLVAASIPRVGVCNATTAIIVGQVAAACIIDHLGLFGVEKIVWNYTKLIGIALFAVGAKLLLN